MKVGEFEFEKAKRTNGARPETVHTLRATTRPAHGALVSWGFFLLRLTSLRQIRT